METYDLYSLSAENLEVAKTAVEQALGLTMLPHESSYHGGDYYRAGAVGQEHFVLERNLDLLDEEPIEVEAPGTAILLYVNETTRAEEIEHKLTSFDPKNILLRREML